MRIARAVQPVVKVKVLIATVVVFIIVIVVEKESADFWLKGVVATRITWLSLLSRPAFVGQTRSFLFVVLTITPCISCLPQYCTDHLGFTLIPEPNS